MTTNEAGCTCGFPDCMKLTSDRATIRNGWDDDDPDVTRIVRRVGAAMNAGRDAAVVAVVLDEVAKAAEPMSDADMLAELVKRGVLRRSIGYQGAAL